MLPWCPSPHPRWLPLPQKSEQKPGWLATRSMQRSLFPLLRACVVWYSSLLPYCSPFQCNRTICANPNDEQQNERAADKNPVQRHASKFGLVRVPIAWVIKRQRVPVYPLERVFFAEIPGRTTGFYDSDEQPQKGTEFTNLSDFDSIPPVFFLCLFLAISH